VKLKLVVETDVAARNIQIDLAGDLETLHITVAQRVDRWTCDQQVVVHKFKYYSGKAV